MIFLEVGNLDGIFLLIFGIMFGPPILLTVIGLFTYPRSKEGAKVLFILALVYLVVGLGICGSMMA
ncbi:hypothetical protein CEQ90_04755 [Lewinellaceae bacterium SD302]|nr:hypothetical protein CEQ90_04755 [Lewinellaceae bacterium SD302]